MLKDEQYFSHNSGGDARTLETWSDFSSLKYLKLSYNLIHKDCISHPIFAEP